MKQKYLYTRSPIWVLNKNATKMFILVTECVCVCVGQCLSGYSPKKKTFCLQWFFFHFLSFFFEIYSYLHASRFVSQFLRLFVCSSVCTYVCDDYLFIYVYCFVGCFYLRLASKRHSHYPIQPCDLYLLEDVWFFFCKFLFKRE